MSATPAALLAGVQQRHPAWRIRRVDGVDWSGYYACRGVPASPEEQVITTASLADLELELISEDSRRTCRQRRP